MFGDSLLINLHIKSDDKLPDYFMPVNKLVVEGRMRKEVIICLILSQWHVNMRCSFITVDGQIWLLLG